MYTTHLPPPYLPDHPGGFILARPQYTTASHIPGPFINPLPAVNDPNTGTEAPKLWIFHNYATSSFTWRTA